MGLWVKIAFVSSEASPYIKVSDLADVSGCLPKYIAKCNNNEVKVFIPKYKIIDFKKYNLQFISKFSIPMYNGEKQGNIYSIYDDNGVEFIFIEYNIYFNRKHIYGNYGNDYPDNLERFVFFSKAVIEAIKILNLDFDVIHCNSWQTALVPVYINQFYRNDPIFRKIKIIFTIHNLSFQGLFPYDVWNMTGLDRSLFVPDIMEFWGKLNLTKGGLLYSDIITTVSESYKKEILTEEYGCGLEGILRDKEKILYGIMNGVDYDIWNPEIDKYNYEITYSICDLTGKSLIKKSLLEEFGFEYKKEIPLISFIGKLDEDSGLDIIEEALDTLLNMDIKLFFIGYGIKRYIDLLFIYQNKYPDKLTIIEDLPEEYIHKTLAASDILLVPSKYEPCGLYHLYGLKYGTIPVVGDAGGLKDTIENDITGFLVDIHSSEEMLICLKNVINIYKNDKNAWLKLMQNAMSKDFSWKKIAEKYIEIYNK